MALAGPEQAQPTANRQPLQRQGAALLYQLGDLLHHRMAGKLTQRFAKQFANFPLMQCIDMVKKNEFFLQALPSSMRFLKAQLSASKCTAAHAQPAHISKPSFAQTATP